ncbi:MAG: CDP-glycerol glycerophosphotransferase family protein, partial [Lachnospiraceae bacterium]
SMVRKDIEYIYMDHAVASANLTLRKHALDNFDTIFATNELMKLEMREMERVYNLKEKTVVEYGYSLIDNMIENYEKQQAEERAKESNDGKEKVAENTQVESVTRNGTADGTKNVAANKVPEILIAPSWQEDNIMDSYIEQMLDALLGHGYHITVRPHPQYVRHYEERLHALGERYKEHEDFELQLDFSSNKTVFDADVLITDWSGIAYEYSFTTLKPTLFINTPMKIMNPDYKEIDIVPFDIEARDQVGISVETDDLANLADVVNRLLTEELYSKDSLKKVREKYLYNVGKSADVGAKYIIKRLIEYSKK